MPIQPLSQRRRSHRPLFIVLTLIAIALVILTLAIHQQLEIGRAPMRTWLIDVRTQSYQTVMATMRP